jgi:RNA polymerase sigma-70 factor (ECF subfamily)
VSKKAIPKTTAAPPKVSTLRGCSMFERDLVALMPALRGFSRMLCGRQGVADDMAQEALTKAWKAQASFQLGTNMKAWLFTILRNEFYSHTRRSWRETHWDADQSEAIPGTPDEQQWSMDLADTERALGTLPDAQREALILVSAGGLSYEETAKICETAIGTVKSRVWRARHGLAAALSADKPLPDRLPFQGMQPADSILGQLNALIAPARRDLQRSL